MKKLIVISVLIAIMLSGCATQPYLYQVYFIDKSSVEICAVGAVLNSRDNVVVFKDENYEVVGYFRDIDYFTSTPTDSCIK